MIWRRVGEAPLGAFIRGVKGNGIAPTHIVMDKLSAL